MHSNRKPNRLPGFDYASDSLYFVSPVVNGRLCCFGEIIDEQMILNEYGIIAEQQWTWLTKQFPYAVSHSFQIMPNHMHGILEINPSYIKENEPVKIKSLSELIGAFKTTSSKKIHLSGFPDFQWQRSFHDHIIRNEIEYINICNYIESNPRNWKADKFFK